MAIMPALIILLCHCINFGSEITLLTFIQHEKSSGIDMGLGCYCGDLIVFSNFNTLSLTTFNSQPSTVSTINQSII